MSWVVGEQVTLTSDLMSRRVGDQAEGQVVDQHGDWSNSWREKPASRNVGENAGILPYDDVNMYRLDYI